MLKCKTGLLLTEILVKMQRFLVLS
uniref:Uncharacterized protein n=1 Tax=Rhizophora mucronata TaxID=61149 RepID=A0A2P2Q068_RHIMU